MSSEPNFIDYLTNISGWTLIGMVVESLNLSNQITIDNTSKKDHMYTLYYKKDKDKETWSFRHHLTNEIEYITQERALEYLASGLNVINLSYLSNGSNNYNVFNHLISGKLYTTNTFRYKDDIIFNIGTHF